MNPQLEKLEALLGRVQQNAVLLAEQRARATALTAAVSERPAQQQALEVSDAPNGDPQANPAAMQDSGGAVRVSAPPRRSELRPEPEPEPELIAELSDEDMATLPPSDAPPAEAEVSPQSSEPSREAMDGLGVSLGFAPNGQGEAGNSVSDAVEVPEEAPRTPPPESGPQVSVLPQRGLSPELAEEDAPVSLSEAGPTMAQLGTTVELEGGQDPADLELAQHGDGDLAASDGSDEYEEPIPEAGFHGGYDASLAPPATAREELAAHDRAERERVERRSMAPGAASSPPGPASTPGAQVGATTRVDRASVDPAVAAATYEPRPPTHPATFLECLDRSLALGRG